MQALQGGGPLASGSKLPPICRRRSFWEGDSGLLSWDTCPGVRMGQGKAQGPRNENTVLEKQRWHWAHPVGGEVQWGWKFWRGNSREAPCSWGVTGCLWPRVLAIGGTGPRLKPPYISEISPMWTWRGFFCCCCFKYFWIWFANVSTRIFASTFLRNISLYVVRFSGTVFGFVIKVTLPFRNELRCVFLLYFLKEFVSDCYPFLSKRQTVVSIQQWINLGLEFSLWGSFNWKFNLFSRYGIVKILYFVLC